MWMKTMRFDVIWSVAPLSTIQSCGRVRDVGVAVKAMRSRPVSVGATAGVSLAAISSAAAPAWIFASAFATASTVVGISPLRLRWATVLR
jgi:hypothetical protein